MPEARTLAETDAVSTNRGGVVRPNNSVTADDRYVAAYNSMEFTALRRRSNAFLTGACVFFYGWWFAGILLATFVPDFFRQKLGGPVNVGLLYVFLTLTLVLVVAVVYLRFASTRLDPASEEIRVALEGDPR
jgi:uncharacterized membrane protein (DUF485 family)